ncbi:hypothetical protein OQJ26_01935 [Legionella sp. PATHC038]|uniref:hypothetical protein n=1 Tax=Legionella sheltonii TaxID=2992041 RepID=UPI002244E548|nr:hypothetical protein [Legionella sp. PATHC038]MCW8397548.1 hypothetical protein [Legionella sp. PATHC038]
MRIRNTQFFSKQCLNFARKCPNIHKDDFVDTGHYGLWYRNMIITDSLFFNVISFTNEQQSRNRQSASRQ